MNQGEGPIRWLLVLAALVCSVQSASAVAVLTPRDTLARTGTNPTSTVRSGRRAIFGSAHDVTL